MMKNILTLLLITSSLALAAKDGYKKSYQTSYLPDAVKDIYIGMHYADFSKLKNGSGMNLDSAFAFMYLKYTENTMSESILSLSYKFDMDDANEDLTKPVPTSPLYEIDIEFKEDFDINALTTKLYGPAKDIAKPGDQYYFYDKQWIITTKDKLTLIIRQAHNYLMIAGIIKGTEWSNE